MRDRIATTKQNIQEQQEKLSQAQNRLQLLEAKHSEIQQQLVAYTHNVEEKEQYIHDLQGKKVTAEDKC